MTSNYEQANSRCEMEITANKEGNYYPKDFMVKSKKFFFVSQQLLSFRFIFSNFFMKRMNDEYFFIKSGLSSQKSLLIQVRIIVVEYTDIIVRKHL